MHLCLDVVAVKYVCVIAKIVFNKNNAIQDLLKHPICLTDSDHDYILKEIEQRDKIELGINSMDNGD